MTPSPDDRLACESGESGWFTFDVVRGLVIRPRFFGLLGRKSDYATLYVERLLVLHDRYEPLLMRVPATLSVVDFEYVGTYDDTNNTWTISLEPLEERSTRETP